MSWVVRPQELFVPVNLDRTGRDHEIVREAIARGVRVSARVRRNVASARRRPGRSHHG